MALFCRTFYKTTAGDVAEAEAKRYTNEDIKLAYSWLYSKMSSLSKEATTVMVSSTIVDEYQNEIKKEVWTAETPAQSTNTQPTQ